MGFMGFMLINPNYPINLKNLLNEIICWKRTPPREAPFFLHAARKAEIARAAREEEAPPQDLDRSPLEPPGAAVSYNYYYVNYFLEVEWKKNNIPRYLLRNGKKRPKKASFLPVIRRKGPRFESKRDI